LFFRFLSNIRKISKHLVSQGAALNLPAKMHIVLLLLDLGAPNTFHSPFIEICADPTDTFAILKKKIESRYQIPEQRQRLFVCRLFCHSSFK